ncbi:hypothetical protein [Sulfurihydrogenibium subterraneum]|uniref:hypothetical protein n=1 Tax=Sulfurihydrogenibium subterraneum TaxID=171121 RepID=UPI000686263D|nr:hypothetical protein [Sulfurihydrogenibium subterraneum]
MKILKAIFILIIGLSFYAKADSFTEKDRELLINLSMQVSELKGRVDGLEKRMEDMNKRIDQIDKKIDQLYTFLWIITGIFTTLTATTIGFALWDRRTYLKALKQEVVQEIEKEGKLSDLIKALRELAKEDPKVATVLKRFNLL